MGGESGHLFEEDLCRSSAIRIDLHKKEQRGRKVLGRLEKGKQRDPSGAEGGEDQVNRWPGRDAAQGGWRK